MFTDELYIAGFRALGSCSATRRRRSTLILPSGLPVIGQVTGDALSVLNTVVTTWSPT
ncbi:MAG TPA: hypothetical protein VF003_03110 [Pseudonocardiaceae bacterium]